MPRNFNFRICSFKGVKHFLDPRCKITVEHFYLKRNQYLWDAIELLYKQNIEIDTTMILNQLMKQDRFEKFGGETHLGYIMSRATTTNPDYLIAELENNRILRGIGKISRTAGIEIQEPDANPKEILDKTESAIMAISTGGSKFEPTRVGKELGRVFEQIQAYANSGGITGVQTGFTRLDELTTGFHPGELIIVGARPGMGKTALALAIANGAAVQTKRPAVPTAFFSLEMPKDQLIQRMLASSAELNLQKIRGGYAGQSDYAKLSEAATLLHKAPLWIDDMPGSTPLDIRAKARRIKHQNGDLGLIIIDYLQLMKANEKTSNRNDEIGSISRTLKEIAKELEVPVIALAQLSRATEQRTTKRPQLSDLRESGSIEQDADIVLFVHRESYYMEKNDSRYIEQQHIGEIIIGKQRNGPLDDIPVHWQGEITKFSNWIGVTDQFGEPDRF